VRVLASRGKSGNLGEKDLTVHTVKAAELGEVHPLGLVVLKSDALCDFLAHGSTPGPSVVGERASETVEFGVLHACIIT